MADPFVGQLALVGFNFAPTGWMPCDGRLIPISRNTALFALLGTTYGGDGKSTFALPNLQDKVPIGFGQGSGLSLYELGEEGGQDPVTLIQNEVPAHSHTVAAAGSIRGVNPVPSPAGGVFYQAASGNNYVSPQNMTQQLNVNGVSAFGGSQPHKNTMPYVGLYWFIAVQGVFPARG